jgi:hypothetical protein
MSGVASNAVNNRLVEVQALLSEAEAMISKASPAELERAELSLQSAAGLLQTADGDPGEVSLVVSQLLRVREFLFNASGLYTGALSAIAPMASTYTPDADPAVWSDSHGAALEG